MKLLNTLNGAKLSLVGTGPEDLRKSDGGYDPDHNQENERQHNCDRDNDNSGNACWGRAAFLDRRGAAVGTEANARFDCIAAR
jgi:hypothetical protein